jgi:hypothetical protein
MTPGCRTRPVRCFVNAAIGLGLLVAAFLAVRQPAYPSDR